MAKKEFKPVITRIKLNPEQAVLACTCYTDGWNYDSFFFPFFTQVNACQNYKDQIVSNLVFSGPSIS